MNTYSEEETSIQERSVAPSFKESCEETRLRALAENHIDRANYKKLVKKGKGVIFDDQGNPKGTARCTKAKFFRID